MVVPVGTPSAVRHRAVHVVLRMDAPRHLLVLVSVLLLHAALLWTLGTAVPIPAIDEAPVLRVQSMEILAPPARTRSPNQPAPVKPTKPAPRLPQPLAQPNQPVPPVSSLPALRSPVPPVSAPTPPVPAPAPAPAPAAANLQPPSAQPLPQPPPAAEPARNAVAAAPALVQTTAPVPAVRESGLSSTAALLASNHAAVVPSESRLATAPAGGSAISQFPASGVPQRLVAPPAALAHGSVSAPESRAGGNLAGPVPATGSASEAQVPTAAATARAPGPAAVVDAVAAPVRKAIALACPVQVAPEMPRGVLREQGDEWQVTAQITINNGVVEGVKILAGPRIFHDKVREAIRKYQCQADGLRVEATQVFRFRLGP